MTGRAAGISIVLAVGLGGGIAERAAADRIELRDGTTLDGRVSALDVGGITLVRSLVRDGARLETSETIGWDRVASIDAPAAPGLAEAPRWLEAGERLWRARLRLDRGDAALAASALGDALDRFRGRDGATPLVAALVDLQIRLAHDDRPAALAAWLDAARLLRSGARAPTLERRIRIGADGSLEQGELFDPTTGLCRELPPIAADDAERAAMVAVLDAFDPRGDPGLAELKALYRSVLTGEGDAPAAAAESTDVRRRAAELLAAMRDAGSSDATVREAGRTALEQQRRRLPAWSEAWARYAIGDSLLRESDDARRLRGQLQLAHLPARWGDSQPWLARLAARRAAAESRRAGREDEAARFERAAGIASSATQSAPTPRTP